MTHHPLAKSGKYKTIEETIKKEKFFLTHKNQSKKQEVKFHLTGMVPPPKVKSVKNPNINMRLLSQSPPSIDAEVFTV